MSIKVALIGTHGIGKTTAAKELFHWAARKAGASLINELARCCPWCINEKTTPQAQRWIFHTQISAELVSSADDRETVVVCDRSALDCLVYAQRAQVLDGFSPEWDWVSLYLKLFEEHWLATYDLIWRMPLDRTRPIEDDGVRSLRPSFQRDIDTYFDMTLANLADSRKIVAWPGLDAAKEELSRLIRGGGER